MKKYYLLIAIVCLNLTMEGRQLSPEEALQRITQGVMKIGSVRPDTYRLAYQVQSTRSDDEASVYVFAHGDDRGYAVLSADDRLTPVLGYSDTGSFDVTDMPQVMVWWLGEMGRQVDYALTNNVPAYEPVAAGPAISPLVTAAWGQGSPYDALTPVIEGRQSPTGCVATALAQIMYAHKWPVQPVGTNSYKDQEAEYSIDYSEYTFEWDKMTDTYGDDSTQESTEAVARLMKSVGYGVNMSYGKSSSGATNTNVDRAMKENFGYRDNYEFIMRGAFTAAEWDELFYTMLSNGMPIFQTGRDGVWLFTSGHAFVCDGYDGNGYYHYNWGWDGKYNGYFLLSCLVPDGAGTGGSIAGYNYRQEALVNLQPDNGREYNDYQYVVARDFAFDSETGAVSVALSSRADVVDVELGISLQAQGSDVPEVRSIGTAIIGEVASGRLPEGWSDGLDRSLVYDMRLVWRKAGDARWRRTLPAMKTGLLVLTQEPLPVGGRLNYDGTAWNLVVTDVDEPDMRIAVNDMTFDGNHVVITDKECIYTVNVTNIRADDYYFHGVHHYLVPVDAPDNKVLITNTNMELAPGESREMAYRVTVPSDKVPTGNYYLSLVEANYNREIYRDESVVYTAAALDEMSFDDGIYVYVNNGDGTVNLESTLSGSPLTGEVTIPAEVVHNGTVYKVAKIVPAWFKLFSAKNVTSLNIQYPIETISSSVISSCAQLQSLTLGEGIRNIEKLTFYSCGLLEFLSLPQSLETIGDSAFNGCKLLSSIELGDNVSTLGSNSFGRCAALTSLKLGRGIKGIPDYCFTGCSKLTELVIPAGVDSIGMRAFSGCTSLTSLTMEGGVRKIGDHAFYNCRELLALELKAGLDSIKTSAFDGCSELLSLSLPEGLRYIGDNAFSYSYKLAAINIPNTTTVVGNSAFYSCKEALTISLGNSLETIGDMAFYQPAKITELEIPSSVRSMGVQAFALPSALKTLTIRSWAMTRIPEKAFNVCGKLESLMICEGVEDIAADAFRSCTRLAYIDLPSTLRSIAKDAFYRMSYGGASTIDVVSRAVVPPTIDTAAFASYIYSNGKLQVLPASYDLYKADTDGWAQFLNVEADPTTSIDDVTVDGDADMFPADVYDVNGRLVVKQASRADFEALEHGLYIVGGRKLVR